ncbi:unnamed protein product [Rotaria magnacalcarata]
MECSCVELNDLPDEILLIIFKKLDNFDILYSFHGIKSKRLNKIIHDPIFTSNLNFVKWSANKFHNKLTSNFALNRFRLQILPDISMKVKWFYLESSSAKNILRAADYPNLYGLGLYNINERQLDVFLLVQHFSQLLYVLDGRFSQLHTLIVDLINNVLSTDLIENKKNVINRLPQLSVFTFDIRSLMFIDQINLPSKKDIEESFRDFQYTKIISYVDYFLEKKTGQCHVFSYPSEMPYYQKITNNFPDGLYQYNWRPLSGPISTRSKKKEEDRGNTTKKIIKSIVQQYVRFISLYDEYPFEHEFFIKISQSFPFMERLSLINHQSQIHKQSYKLTNHNFNSTIVKYNYLITLDIEEVHDDYIEEFLFNTKTYFHNNIVMSINYKSLERVTRNFTRDVTRINSAKINEIFLSGEKHYSNSLRDYFPCAIIH